MIARSHRFSVALVG
ncbi:hypothetical protein GQ607_003972 [Colletotrichum asianum]|uniref:Uncharacterized protein n=1 Tax=Colletotrichum asianum TaxID=702518 RepID=A0A8H3WNA6_9PEZI|nr:hypothetical protein GQ607_003972 [Colletotrichum asianum]